MISGGIGGSESLDVHTNRWLSVHFGIDTANVLAHLPATQIEFVAGQRKRPCSTSGYIAGLSAFPWANEAFGRVCLCAQGQARLSVFGAEVKEVRYKADITAGALKLPESRLIADLLLRQVDADAWNDAIVTKNVLQARNPATARRLTTLIRRRLETVGPELWKLVRDGKGTVAAHAVLATAVKHSQLLGDFLEIVVAEQYRLFSPALSPKLFDDYLESCRERDPEMPQWNESTRRRLRSSVFQMLAQAGYIENTRSLKLQTVHVADQVLRYLKANNEDYVLRCIQVAP